MQGSSKNQEMEGGPGPREKLEGSMKEGCVREFVKGGVCERQGQRETLAPSVREDRLYPVCRPGRLPKTQPRVPPLLEPPDTLSPSPLFGGVGGGIQRPQKKRGVREKQGSVGLAMAWCIPSEQADWLPGPCEPIPGPPAPQTLALRQPESPWRSSSSRRVSPQERPLLPAGEPQGKHRAGG